MGEIKEFVISSRPESGDPTETTTRSAADAADGGGGGMDERKKLVLKVAGGLAVLVVVVVAVVLGVRAAGGGGSDCAEDKFTEVLYTDQDKKEVGCSVVFVEDLLIRHFLFRQQVYLKFKFAMKEDEDMYNYEEAKAACKGMGAELWEVLGGEAEWAAISKFMNNDEVFKIRGFWLSAEVRENCPEGVAAKCNSAEARWGGHLLPQS